MWHQIDLDLDAVKHRAPSERLDVIWRSYEESTGLSIERPPTEEQRKEVHGWLRGLHADEPSPTFIVADRMLKGAAASSISAKAGTVYQARCGACELLINDDGTIARAVRFPIDVEPWARQSHPKAVELRDAVREALIDRGWHVPYTSGPMCVSILAIVPHSSSMKDVDNLVKGLLDSMQGVLYKDDKQIQCLTSRRMEYSGRIGHYLVRADAVHPWGADVVWDDGQPANVRSRGRIRI